MGLSEMFARGLLERGESLGINKTLMSAVSELRVSLRSGRPCLFMPFHAVTAKHTRLGLVIDSFTRCIILYVPPRR